MNICVVYCDEYVCFFFNFIIIVDLIFLNDELWNLGYVCIVIGVWCFVWYIIDI